MTIKEFYEWAKSRNIEDYEVHTLYHVSVGCHYYYNCLKEEDITVDIENKVVEL